MLISMFVLLFGLMGVASIFPVGNHYAGRGDQYERGAALADAAFAQLKARGLLRPDKWLYGDMAPQGAPALGASDHRLIQNPLPVAWTAPRTFREGFFNLGGNDGPGYAFVIDPLGVAYARQSGAAYSDIFPYALFDNTNANGSAGGNPSIASNVQNPWNRAYGGPLDDERWPIRRVTMPTASLVSPAMTARAAEGMCTLHDDLAVELPRESDRPGVQRWQSIDLNATPTPNNPADDTPLSRQFTGNYSWLATVVPTSDLGRAAMQPGHPMYGTELYEVSAVVFYKRVASPSADSERAIAAMLNSGGELVIYAPNNGVEAVDAASRDIRAGQWIALAGVHPVSGRFLLKWYRLLSFDDQTELDYPPPAGTGKWAVRRAMLEGPDWPADPTKPLASRYPVTNLRAILLPGAIGVSTHYLPLER
ncbi:hypothetical protein DCC79_08125 [bacterium]|nr:MAG: hypothetical protein DCC79_08125 [bacterium]